MTALATKSSTGTVSTSNLASFTATGGYVTLATANTVSTFVGTSSTELASNVLGPTSLLGMLASVDPAYYGNSAWYFNPVQLYNMRALVDANKRPLLAFENGFDAERLTGPESEFEGMNAPIARLYGFDVYADASIPALTASTTGGHVFDDLSKAMVQRTVGSQGEGTSVMVLRERYADYLAVAVYAYHRTDIRSNDLRAAVTVKPAAT
jgi:HK97 family phage major capsid protein